MGQSKKRKNRAGNRASKSARFSKTTAGLVTPPPLPSLDIPKFNLHCQDIHDGSDTTQDQYPNKRPKKEKPHAPESAEFCVSPARLKRMVRNSDLQELVLWILADGVAAQWLLVKRKQDIRKVVVVMVPGLDMTLFDGTFDLNLPESAAEDMDMGETIKRDELYGDVLSQQQDSEKEEGEIEADNQSWVVVENKIKNWGAKDSRLSNFPVPLLDRALPPCLASIKDIFTHVWPTKADGDDKYNKIHSPITGFLNVPLTAPTPPAPHRKSGNTRIGVTQLLTSPEELYENQYPTHSSLLKHTTPTKNDTIREGSATTKAGWVETVITLEEVAKPEAGSVTEGRNIYAVDCEMCNTAEGPELTRVSIINWDGEVVYDALVKPSRPVIDYLTR